jgi:hypothetical protein
VGGPPYRVAEVGFSYWEIMEAVFRTGLHPREVFERLDRLGITARK